MAGDDPGVTFKRCPRCGRAVPSHSGEHFCPNDGARLLTACPACGAPIASPYAHFCTRCGASLGPSFGNTPSGGTA